MHIQNRQWLPQGGILSACAISLVITHVLPTQDKAHLSAFQANGCFGNECTSVTTRQRHIMFLHHRFEKNTLSAKSSYFQKFHCPHFERNIVVSSLANVVAVMLARLNESATLSYAFILSCMQRASLYA